MCQLRSYSDGNYNKCQWRRILISKIVSELSIFSSPSEFTTCSSSTLLCLWIKNIHHLFKVTVKIVQYTHQLTSTFKINTNVWTKDMFFQKLSRPFDILNIRSWLPYAIAQSERYLRIGRRWNSMLQLQKHMLLFLKHMIVTKSSLFSSGRDCKEKWMTGVK